MRLPRECFQSVRLKYEKNKSDSTCMIAFEKKRDRMKEREGGKRGKRGEFTQKYLCRLHSVRVCNVENILRYL